MKKAIKIILCSLIVIGAINWGLVGLFKFDLVSYLFGEMTITSRIIYSIIGVSAVLGTLYCWIFDSCNNDDNCGC